MAEGTSHETAAPETKGNVIHWARGYDVLTSLVGLGGVSEVRSLTLDRAEVAPGEHVLDVGCGTGTLALLAKQRVGPDGEVHGIDASPQMIERARKKAAAEGSDIAFRTAVIEDLPFADETFDAVLSTFMLHHLPDDVKSAGFAQIARVLKPGGRLLAVDMSGEGSGVWRVFSFFIRHHLPKDYVERLRAMIAGTGLATEQIETGHEQFAFIRATKT